MQEYFITLVDGTIEASVMYVREYVHAYLSDMLEEAKGQIQTYGQSFSATMQAALTTRQQGEPPSGQVGQTTLTNIVWKHDCGRHPPCFRVHCLGFPLLSLSISLRSGSHKDADRLKTEAYI